ncbi:MAG: DUF4404 family protein [Gammaproteobacteria bacterium]|uniref:DUF4404 family protein n=1 Tax=Pseudomaricurvus alcaniphilus TaxID=1166482 RepID=UPI00140B6B24|nr:DUF4404 family protein [Pseudomaricurvus alcaniphilus]MBR9913146.1 DUF4404 family protein [Gammaproteobacteria bacterium]NHN37569.1 DUF4404 family protein [Pseudomaricurvus alcaniphilus]
MSEDKLKDSIAEVKELMQTALDGKERDLLGDLMKGITKKHPAEIDESISDQLDSKAVEFESKHPKLARALREVLDSLNKMGV